MSRSGPACIAVSGLVDRRMQSFPVSGDLGLRFPVSGDLGLRVSGDLGLRASGILSGLSRLLGLFDVYGSFRK